MNPTPRLRANVAIVLSASLIVAVCLVVNDSPIETAQESFYDLAKNSLTHGGSPVDQLAFSKSLELSQVPDQNILLTDSLIKAEPQTSSKKSAVNSETKNRINEHPTSLMADSLVSSNAPAHSDDQQSSSYSKNQMLAAKAAIAAKFASDPSWVGYQSFNDLLKEAIQKEKQKRVQFHQELVKMGRESPAFLEKQFKKQSQIEASDKTRKEEAAGALKKIEEHLSRHIAGILSLQAPVQQHTSDNTEKTNEEYEKLARLKYEASVKVERMKRERAMKEADKKAREKMERHLDDDVGNILSSVVPGPGGVKAKPEHKFESNEVLQKHQASHPQALKTAPETKALMKEVKNYIDSEIAKEVHSAVPKVTVTKSSDDAAKELATLRADILAGHFQQAVKLASNSNHKAAPAKKDDAASKVGPLDQSTIKSFNALFGKLVKGG